MGGIRASRIGTAMLAVALVVPVAHAAAAGSGLLVTIAARECPTYESITANLARNNIQESLRDLGQDTAYQSGQPIDPTTEHDNQRTCLAIPDWSFTLGKGIKARAVVGPWGALSIVTSPFSGIPKTLASVPLLGTDGRPVVPAQTVKGAVTIELTQEQANLAARSNSLWIQGGTTTDPVLDQQFPGQFGFGALRCAIDNLNGDNVEWISFPAGTKHVFCYAYYVRPPPTSGTIIIRKQVTGAPSATQTFTFAGNISYDPSGTFSLNVNNGQPASATFFRAESTSANPWVVREQVPPGWTLTDLTCAHGASAVAVDAAAGQASIALAPGDTVTCTYTDALTPPPGALLIRKVTDGGVGRFGFAVSADGSDDILARAFATTTSEGDPVSAVPGPITLEAGRYDIKETAPAATDRGTWHTSGVFCDGIRRDTADTATVDISPGNGAVCTFHNTFVPRGALDIDKVTLGALGTANFVILPMDDSGVQFRQSATTTQQGVAARATGSSTHGIPLGDYAITEGDGSTKTASGTWRLVEVTCNGELVPWAQGRAVVRLTTRAPAVHCVFTNHFDPTIEPPGPTPGPDPIPGGPTPDLEVSKTTAQTTPQVGDIVHYELRVGNSGSVTAQGVVVNDLPQESGKILVARTSTGTCDVRVHGARCDLGDLPPNHHDTVHLSMRVEADGTITNFAVAGSISPDDHLSDNLAHVTVRVRPHGRFNPCPGARAARAPGAHAAC